MCPIITAASIFTVWCNSAIRRIINKSRLSLKDFERSSPGFRADKPETSCSWVTIRSVRVTAASLPIGDISRRYVVPAE
jgi:hypothetical protein